MRLFILLIACVSAFAQTVYLRTSGPAAQVIVGATNATPIVIQTQNGHGLASTCGVSTTCPYTVQGVATGTGISPATGTFKAHYVDATHLALYSLSNTAVPAVVNGNGGNWFKGYSPTGSQLTGAWGAPVTAVTLGAQPLGYFDGPTGDLTRGVSLNPLNGLTSIVVSGGSAGSCASVPCAVTVTTNYDPTIGKYPVSVGAKFSVQGTNTPLGTCGLGGGAFSPYTMSTVNSSGWTAPVTCASLTTGDYTNVNLHCGPSATPNDLIGGVRSCTSVSTAAYTGSEWWEGMISLASNHLQSSPAFKTVWEGGNLYPGPGLLGQYEVSALRFMADPTSSLYLSECIYAMDFVERTTGVNFTWNESAGALQANSDLNYSIGTRSIGTIYSAAHAYHMASKAAIFLNKIYNDVDDPANTTATKANTDLSNPANHNWVLSSGNVAAGANDATHVMLASAAHCIAGTEIQLGNGVLDYSHYSYGKVATCVGAQATMAAPFSGAAPARDNMISGTYTGGLTVSGTTGQWCSLNDTGGTYAYLRLTGPDAIAGGSPLVLIQTGNGYGSPVTSMSVTGYAGSAVCSGTATVSTVVGTPYTVFDTITYSTTAAGASATVTFTRTTGLSGSLHVGDGLIGYNGWGNNFTAAAYICMVTAVASTSATCKIGASGGIVAGPVMAWRIPAWTTNDVGLVWGTKHGTTGGVGVSSAVYPKQAQIFMSGSAESLTVQIGPNGGGGDYSALQTMDFAMAAEDPRAIRDLTRVQSYNWDFVLRASMDSVTGFSNDGSGYSMDADLPTLELISWSMANSTTGSVPTFPSLLGAWNSNGAIQQMFQALPDLQSDVVWLAGWGYQSGFGLNGTAALYGTSTNASVGQSPTSRNARLYRNWLENVTSYASSPISFWGRNGTLQEVSALAFLHNNPSVGSINYRTQPTQYVFNQASPALMTSLTGWPSTGYRFDAMISRSGWSSKSDSLLLWNTSSWWWRSGYQAPPISTYFYKGSYLLGNDCDPPGGCLYDGANPAVTDSAVQFAGETSVYNLFTANGSANITRWANASAGSFGAQYGDQNSNYAYVCSDAAGVYNIVTVSPIYVKRCVLHLKKPAYDEFLFEFDDDSISSGKAIARHITYSQNGQSFQSPALTSGSTTLVGRVIKSIESNTGTSTFGLMSYIASPSTITVADAGTLSNGSRSIAIHAGIPGSSQTAFTSVIAHKVMQTVTDTPYTTTDLNPDANFTGVFACGALSCAGYLEARNNTTQTSVANFTASPSVAKSQWVIAGIAAGAYTPTVNGAAVSSCNGGPTPCTVSAGDNSLYFEDTHTGSLTVSITPGSHATRISGTATVRGNTVMK